MTAKSLGSWFFAVFLFPWQSRRAVEHAAENVAGRCRASLGWRVYRQAGDMSVAEIRGYVRALAWEYVYDEIAKLPAFKPALRSRVVGAAVEKLVRMVSYDAVNKLAFVDKTTLAA
jgi:hypothetical protein